MKTLFVIKFYVVLACWICKPGDYSYRVVDSNQHQDTGMIYSTAKYDVGDTIPLRSVIYHKP
jgi:hypothetical protein